MSKRARFSFLMTSCLCGVLSLSSCEVWKQDDEFLKKADRDINAFHHFLNNLDTAQDQMMKASNQNKGSLYSGNEGKNIKKGSIQKTGGSNDHHFEKGKKLDEKKENRKKEWEENSGKRKDAKKGKHYKKSHHSSGHHHLGDIFKDAHKYNNGNYVKGFNHKYHLDEVKKHRKFWKNHDSKKKWKTFGGHNSKNESKHKGKHNTNNSKDSSTGSEKGKENKSMNSSHSSQKQGHKKEEGHQIVYAHEKKEGENKSRK